MPVRKRRKSGVIVHVERWRDLVSRHFPARVVDDALRLVFYESSGDPNAVHLNTNGTLEVGLFQMNSGNMQGFGVNTLERWRELMSHPETNVKAALRLWREAGERFGKDWVTARKHAIR
jgi:hypothetical protein